MTGRKPRRDNLCLRGHLVEGDNAVPTWGGKYFACRKCKRLTQNESAREKRRNKKLLRERAKDVSLNGEGRGGMETLNAPLWIAVVDGDL